MENNNWDVEKFKHTWRFSSPIKLINIRYLTSGLKFLMAAIIRYRLFLKLVLSVINLLSALTDEKIHLLKKNWELFFKMFYVFMVLDMKMTSVLLSDNKPGQDILNIFLPGRWSLDILHSLGLWQLPMDVCKEPLALPRVHVKCGCHCQDWISVPKLGGTKVLAHLSYHKAASALGNSLETPLASSLLLMPPHSCFTSLTTKEPKCWHILHTVQSELSCSSSPSGLRTPPADSLLFILSLLSHAFLKEDNWLFCSLNTLPWPS